MPKPDRSNLARIALSQVGVREEGGNNCGPMIRTYQAATWLAPAAWPWCAAFVDWVVLEWLKGMTPDARAQVTGGSPVDAWRPRTAGAYDLVRWAREHGLPVLPAKGYDVETGDLVIFDFSHCGIASTLRSRTTPTIRTIEGNTGPSGLRDSDEGDGVFEKVRPRALVRAFIRLERGA